MAQSEIATATDGGLSSGSTSWGTVDVKTGKVSEIKLPPPTEAFLQEGDLSVQDLNVLARQRPRRPGADVNGPDVWVGNYSGQNLMRINIETMKTTFYPAPRMGLNPYMVAVDASHNVWVSFHGGDEVGKFDPKTEKWTALYSWPSRGTGLRHLGLAGSQRRRPGGRRVLQRRPGWPDGDAHGKRSADAAGAGTVSTRVMNRRRDPLTPVPG